MKNNQDSPDAEMQKRLAEKQLSHINLFFSAYGNFLNGIFCIAQYFLTGHSLFGYVTFALILTIFLTTYSLSYSKKSLGNEKIWNYITICANNLGPLNPAFLLLGIIFALNMNYITVILWIAIEIVQLSCYVFTFKKFFPNAGISLRDKVYNWLKNNIALIITIVMSIIFGGLWYFSPNNSRYADLWLNLFAGFIASSFTISVIDRILKKQKESSERPLRHSMYRDIQLFTSRFISLWEEMYLHSVETRTNMTLDEFFSSSTIDIIRGNLDLSCSANVYPSQTWFSHIENSRKDLVDKGQKILSVYSNIAEPEVLQAVHYLINDSTYLGRLNLITQMRMCDTRENIPRPTILAYYTLEPSDMDSIMTSQLFRWCHTQYTKLHKAQNNSNVNIFSIPTQLDFQSYKSAPKPTSAITIEKLNSMTNAYQEWKKSHNSSTT